MPEFRLENRRRSARPTSFTNNERCKQKVLLSGLDCLPGQLDLFEVDALPKEIPDAQTHPDRGPD